MRRPRATFWRKGRISSGFVGPPKAINSTASTVTVTRAASPPQAEGGERGVRPGSVVTRAASPPRAEGGERWVRPGSVVTRAASPPRAEGGERGVRPGSVRSSLGTHLMDHVDQRLHVIERRGGQDAVAEVEDVAGTAGGAAQ